MEHFERMLVEHPEQRMIFVEARRLDVDDPAGTVGCLTLKCGFTDYVVNAVTSAFADVYPLVQLITEEERREPTFVRTGYRRDPMDLPWSSARECDLRVENVEQPPERSDRCGRVRPTEH